MYTTACTNIKGFLFAQTLLPHIGARITCFRLCMSVDSKETLGISFTEALCLLRHLIQITRRRKKGINTLMSKWGENGRDWLKSASSYFKSLVPTWTYMNKNATHPRNDLWHFQIDRISALPSFGIATRVFCILTRWSMAPDSAKNSALISSRNAWSFSTKSLKLLNRNFHKDKRVDKISLIPTDTISEPCWIFVAACSYK